MRGALDLHRIFLSTWNERNIKTSLYIYYEVQWCILRDKQVCLKFSTDLVLQICNKGKRMSEVLKAVTMNILVYLVKILYRLVDGHNWSNRRKHGFNIAGKTVNLQRRSHYVNVQNECYRHCLHTAWGVSSLVTRSGLINSLEFFWRIAIGFVFHTVDIS